MNDIKMEQLFTPVFGERWFVPSDLWSRIISSMPVKFLSMEDLLSTSLIRLWQKDTTMSAQILNPYIPQSQKKLEH